MNKQIYKKNHTNKHFSVKKLIFSKKKRPEPSFRTLQTVIFCLHR